LGWGWGWSWGWGYGRVGVTVGLGLVCPNLVVLVDGVEIEVGELKVFDPLQHAREQVSTHTWVHVRRGRREACGVRRAGGHGAAGYRAG